MLAGVEHEQHPDGRQLVRECLGGGAARGDSDTDRGRGRVADELGLGDRGELDEDDAVGGRGACSCRDREPSLAAAARPGKGEHAGMGELFRDRRELVVTPDEARHLGRQPLRGEPVALVARGEQLAVERSGLCRGVGLETATKPGAQTLVLGERILASAERVVDVHQPAVRGLEQRVDRERTLQRLECILRRLPLGELEAECAVQVVERRAARLGPRLVSILGQQLTAVGVEGGLVCGWVAGGASGGGRSFERLDVGVDVDPEREHAVVERQLIRAQHAAGGVHDLMEVVACGVVIGPEELRCLLPVEPVAAFERQDLHEAARLAEAPDMLVDGLAVDRDGEVAEQADLYAARSQSRSSKCRSGPWLPPASSARSSPIVP